MENNKDFKLAIQDSPSEIKAIASQIRALIYKILPNAGEVLWIKQKNIGFGTGQKKKTEHFCWIMLASKHVSIAFNYGAELPDSKNILEGIGKLFRHIKVKSNSDLSNPDLIALLNIL